MRAIKHHGGIDDDPRTDRARGRAAIETGMANVRRHLANVKQFGLPCVVAVNRRPGDTNEEVELVKRLALEAGAFRAEANEGFAKGGDRRGRPRLRGRRRLRRAAASSAMLYEDDWTIQDKIEAIARRVYGAADVYFYPEAEKKIGQYSADGLDQFPICMAKTHLSLSSDPELLNAPENFSLPVRDIRAYTGAGWLVPLCGDITQMPGLGKTPGGAQRRHRRERAHRRAVLSASSRPTISRSWQRSPLPVGRRRASPGRRWSTSPRTPCAAGWRPGATAPASAFHPSRSCRRRLGISRGTLRTALQRLEESGEIVRRQGSGTFVGRAASWTLDEGLEKLVSYHELARRRGLRLELAHLEIEQRALGAEQGRLFALDPQTTATTITRVLVMDGVPGAHMRDVVHPSVALPPPSQAAPARWSAVRWCSTSCSSSACPWPTTARTSWRGC